MKTKNTTTRKIILAEAVLVLGVLIYLYASADPKAISPISGQTIFDPDFTFEVESGGEILISINENFDNQIVLREGDEIDLPPGTYYWKVKNWIREGSINKFTIQSNVGLNLREGEEKSLLENSGNVPLNITKKKGGITSSVGLESGKSLEVEKDNSSYEGGQNG